ncbi:MAG TPA: glutamine-hydrolyzing carbamoyl-phosphate synthase small subunit [Spirochaetales bacterium]|nr:glutamine-hydrolyzing carbamoyl-phosphate synthase small subunit [Spirochaetales bacterium]HRY55861.1 glutamine-hydrolyzing carbamoyl-phosphate synthase small subunit [Spirochaetia bacterium]HRZ65410.1 glutamine-hydrolyzing carbamoyl-phosphate synthase small subunit [Spirochaetia bacterium]
MRNEESRVRRALLRLEDGSCYEGRSFGAGGSIAGEVVFTTGMTGYPQALTDPSFHGQILVCSYPLVGNYGVPGPGRDRWGIPLHFESERIWAAGLVVSEACRSPSHFASERGLPDWLAEEGVPGIEGIDTRALTMRLRVRGVMRGSIEVEGAEPGAAGEGPAHPVARVSPASPRLYNEGGRPRVALIDCGAKNNILRCLLGRGAEVRVLPWDASLEGLEYDGLFLSNGPGDPKACTKTIATLRRALAEERPVFGVCLGAQLLGLAAGADTYKLRYGHRGQNQPCVERGSGRCYITSQNHGYALREESLPAGWEAWFENGNDGTVEGIRSTEGPFSAVQFHPEGCPGPRDTEFLFDAFLEEAEARAPRAGKARDARPAAALAGGAR